MARNEGVANSSILTRCKPAALLYQFIWSDEKKMPVGGGLELFRFQRIKIYDIRMGWQAIAEVRTI